MSAGQKLRAAREALGLTVRDVERASFEIASKYKSQEYALPKSRLSDIETKGFPASIFRLYTLAAIYRLDPLEILSWYGIEVANLTIDSAAVPAPKTHTITPFVPKAAKLPVKMDPGFDLRRTTDLARMVQKWGPVPLSFLEGLANLENMTYGYIGTEDFTMYPLLTPGSFVQIDQTKTEVIMAVWRSERERPIYFVETRAGFTCSWCVVQNKRLILQPHPLSPTPIRNFTIPDEAEVVGQVVGIAMRLEEWTIPGRPEPAMLT